MFTTKDFEKILQRLETRSVEDLCTEDFPDPLYATWLPKEAQKEIARVVKILAPLKKDKMRLVHDVWPQLVGEFKIIHPWFIDSRMQSIWENLYLKHPNKMQIFAHYLLKIPNSFVESKSSFDKHKGEIATCEQMLLDTQKLLTTMEEYQCYFYGHMLYPNHSDVSEELEKMMQYCTNELEKFRHTVVIESYADEDHPITRELHSEKALPIFFARKLGSFFHKEFNKPMNDTVAEMVNIAFGTEYIDNQICKFMKQLPKSDNSQR